MSGSSWFIRNFVFSGYEPDKRYGFKFWLWAVIGTLLIWIEILWFWVWRIGLAFAGLYGLVRLIHWMWYQ